MAKKKRSVEKNYALTKATPDKVVRAPALSYKPPRTKDYRPGIGIIGCGGIVATHLEAYRNARLRVVALADPIVERAIAYRDKFYPRSEVFASADELLEKSAVEVVDIATYPDVRADLMMAAIRKGKHILSQKPFVTDLDVGRKLVAAARRKGVMMAVNQNGRWAPHVSYARQAIEAGILGDISSVDMSVHWDHNWVATTPFNRIPNLLFYDFGIHWFDMLHCYSGGQKAKSVVAAVNRTKWQQAKPPLSGHANVEYSNLQASIVLRGDTRFGPVDRTVIVGTKGTLISTGPNINDQTVTLYTSQGVATPRLTTRWFPDGFDGTMSELLCAIEQDREPYNSARDNLRSLSLCFAALASADSGEPVRPD